MALNQNKAKFEDPANPAIVAGAAAAMKTEDAAPAATTQVAVAPKAGLPAVTGSKYVDYFKQFANAIEPVKYGTLPRVLATQGGLFIKGNGTPDVNLGERIEVTILSYHSEWTITPGDDKAPKELVKYSMDNSTIEGTGQSVQAYIDSLIAQGYKGAKSKEYVHVFGVLEATAKPSDKIGDIVDVSLAPDSVSSWQNHKLQRSQKISRGILPADGSERISITAVAKQRPGQNWTAAVVDAAEKGRPA